jgi:ferritin-like protein
MVGTPLEDEVAERIEEIARLEDRKVSQLAAAALGLYALMPREAHAALRQIEASGDPEDLVLVARKLARVLLDIRYDIAETAAIDSIERSRLPDDFDSEEEILEVATRLVRPRNAPVRDRAGPPPGGGSSRRAG